MSVASLSPMGVDAEADPRRRKFGVVDMRGFYLCIERGTRMCNSISTDEYQTTRYSRVDRTMAPSRWSTVRTDGGRGAAMEARRGSRAGHAVELP